MIVREFVYGDMQQVMKIACNSLDEYYTPDFFMSIWQVSPDGFLVAEDGGKVVGFLLGVMAEVSTIRILMICIRKDYRRQGIGSALLNQIMEKFEGIRRVYLEVKTTNKGAIRMYKRHGFIIKKELPNFYPDGTDGYLMEKMLL